MSLSVFLLFLFSTVLVSATPGPNMLLAFQYGLNHGVRQTLWVLAGLSFGLFMLLVSALLGIDIISRKLPWLLTVMKVAGALYLIYLGVQSWRYADDTVQFNKDAESQVPQSQTQAQAKGHIVKSATQRFRQGMWVSLSNPKAILFFAAFFPKFINFNAPLWPQYVWLTLGFFISETTWQMAYTIGGTKLSGWLGQGSRLLWLNRICGLIFIFIAIALLWEVVAVNI
ncbi:Homoserine/homoserine lactone efflux protein [Psychrobacter pasteurii]|uniref:Homoserine/homoserine lactone efflux protein n=1 Tax=Psychrobacter pasteurii TaxID=1945520 RepID=A0A1R4ED36_9GAMM|nr:LysE family translocator [Psychrobacter pasteurii]SJM36339.1 Homoserine/homoserine lactone efflux protein [Psychrobacter pasteurii]